MAAPHLPLPVSPVPHAERQRGPLAGFWARCVATGSARGRAARLASLAWLGLELGLTASTLVIGLPGCASGEPALRAPGQARLLLVGEQHDAAEHQQLQAQLVRTLAGADRLAALAIEMADAGHDTRALARDASEAAVREALRWDDAGWPWTAYGPVVMAAVRAGVPVLGANLSRAQLGSAMADAALDRQLDAAALETQRAAVREGHCGLLPETQIAPMTRIQIARDVQMARTLQTVAEPGKTVLLVAGGGHVRRDIGVPRHLDRPEPGQRAAQGSAQVIWLQTGDATAPAWLQEHDELRRTPALPAKDDCAELRERFRSRPAAR